jgi:hypothetical protein
LTFQNSASSGLKQEEMFSTRNFARQELPIYTVVCTPQPTPVLEEAFFLNTMDLPNPHKVMSSQIQLQFESQNSLMSIDQVDRLTLNDQ